MLAVGVLVTTAASVPTAPVALFSLADVQVREAGVVSASGRDGLVVGGDDITLAEVRALLLQAQDFAEEQGEALSPTVAQASAELGMLFVTYEAQREILDQADVGLPVAGPTTGWLLVGADPREDSQEDDLFADDLFADDPLGTVPASPTPAPTVAPTVEPEDASTAGGGLQPAAVEPWAEQASNIEDWADSAGTKRAPLPAGTVPDGGLPDGVAPDATASDETAAGEIGPDTSGRDGTASDETARDDEAGYEVTGDDHATHEHSNGLVTLADLSVAAMRLAGLLDPSTASALVEVVPAPGAATAAEGADLLGLLRESVGLYGTTTAGYRNGRIPADVLCELDFAPGHRLRCDAAERLEALNDAYEDRFGRSIPMTDSYRSYESQVAVRRAKPTLAAIPGTSNHGWGLAVDLGRPISTGSSAEYRWMRVNGPDYGWDNPSWARLDGSKPEPWHFEFFAAGAIPDRALDEDDVDVWPTPHDRAPSPDKDAPSVPTTPPAVRPTPTPTPTTPSPKPTPTPTEPSPTPTEPSPTPTPTEPSPTPTPTEPSPTPTPTEPSPTPTPTEPSPTPTPTQPAPEPTPTEPAPEPSPTPTEPAPEPSPEPTTTASTEPEDVTGPVDQPTESPTP